MTRKKLKDLAQENWRGKEDTLRLLHRSQGGKRAALRHMVAKVADVTKDNLTRLCSDNPSCLDDCEFIRLF